MLCPFGYYKIYGTDVIGVGEGSSVTSIQEMVGMEGSEKGGGNFLNSGRIDRFLSVHCLVDIIRLGLYT